MPRRKAERHNCRVPLRRRRQGRRVRPRRVWLQRRHISIYMTFAWFLPMRFARTHSLTSRSKIQPGPALFQENLTEAALYRAWQTGDDRVISSSGGKSPDGTVAPAAADALFP